MNPIAAQSDNNFCLRALAVYPLPSRGMDDEWSPFFKYGMLSN